MSARGTRAKETEKRSQNQTEREGTKPTWPKGVRADRGTQRAGRTQPTGNQHLRDKGKDNTGVGGREVRFPPAASVGGGTPAHTA